MVKDELVLNVENARIKADRMTQIAGDLKETLDIISKEMEKIADKSDNSNIIYYSEKALNLRNKLDEFRNTFYKVNEQVSKSSKDIKTIANTVEVQ